MAKLIGNLLSGSLGPYVFKIVNGKQVVTQKPSAGTIKHSSGTKLATKVFANAATLGAAVRKSLITPSAGLMGPAANAITANLCKALNSSLDKQSGKFYFGEDSFAVLDGLEFNSKSKVISFLPKLPVISLNRNLLSISQPKMDILKKFKFPPNAIKCEFTFALSLFRLHDGYMVEGAETQTVVAFINEGVLGPFEVNFYVPPGCLCLVSLFLDYYTADKSGWILLKDKIFSPGCFCGSIVTDGKYRDSDNRVWKKCIKFK